MNFKGILNHTLNHKGKEVKCVHTHTHTYTYTPGYFVQKITLISMKFHIGKIKNIYSFLWDIPMSVLTLQKKRKKVLNTQIILEGKYTYRSQSSLHIFIVIYF